MLRHIPIRRPTTAVAAVAAGEGEARSVGISAGFSAIGNGSGKPLCVRSALGA